MTMGVSRVGGGANAPLEFENDDVICCSPVRNPKFFARALGARIKTHLNLVENVKNHEIFPFLPSAREKSTIVFHSVRTAQSGFCYLP